MVTSNQSVPEKAIENGVSGYWIREMWWIRGLKILSVLCPICSNNIPISHHLDPVFC